MAKKPVELSEAERLDREIEALKVKRAKAIQKEEGAVVDGVRRFLKKVETERLSGLSAALRKACDDEAESRK